ncbi:hypothetical protein ElyMa_006020200 [Elysia marginata]|uniref:Uncharacterized protein n=1 Tax=Elysia marginata TaxID=1093978 RepID=A0AAV4GIM6_9GAST|nr:hypothetical protein ElyMa_006020200 [Elysia marginata]
MLLQLVALLFDQLARYSVLGGAPAGESYTETVLEDGTVVKQRRSVKYSHGPPGEDNMSAQEGQVIPAGDGMPRQEEEVEDTEEIMPDGTVHHVHKVHRHSVKVTQKALRSEDGQEQVVEEKEDVPGSRSEEVVETFQEPPRMVHQEDVVEEVMPDGTRVTRKVVMKRMVSHTHTHQESFDEGAGGSKKVEDFDMDEVVPGTETAFLEGVESSDSEQEGDEELSMHKTTDVKETTEVLDDGTVVKKTLLTTEKSRKTRSRSGSVDRSETSRRVEEETVIPSPRPRSPVDDGEPETEDVVEEVMPDGTRVTRKVVMNRMVSHTHTHQESFDEGAGGSKKVEDFDMDEVVPGTETAFLEGGESSDSEQEGDEELSMHKTTDVKETTEVLDDGTVVKKTLLTTEKSRKTRSRSGSVDRSETNTRVEEETMIPSPRPRSPVDDGEPETEVKDAVKTTTRTAHYEEEHDHGTVEKTLEMVEDMLARGTLKTEETATEQQGDQPEVTANNENVTPNATVSPEWRELDDPGFAKRQVIKVTYYADDLDPSGERLHGVPRISLA